VRAKQQRPSVAKTAEGPSSELESQYELVREALAGKIIQREQFTGKRSFSHAIEQHSKC